MSATAQQQDENRVDLQPDADTAAVGTCNEFTVVVNDAGGNRDAGETIELEIAQSDADTNQDLEIGFCDPATERGTPADATGPADCDDNPQIGGGGCPAPVAPGVEAPARAEDVCVTQADVANTPQNEAGTCTFGVYSTEPGQMQVRATHTTTNQFGDQVVFQDTSTKTWVAGGPAAVTNLDCEPEAAQNPEGTQHQFTCTATNANGVPIANVDVEARIVAGPNADDPATPANEGEPVVCGQPNPQNPNQGQVTGPAPTNNQGQVVCQYQDQPDGDLGTDTIVGFVDQDNDDVIDAGEPQDQITKNWGGPARFIDCDPETAENASGTQHTITCTVTDREGQPVAGEQVTFTETGPGRFEGGNADTTDAQGQATITTTTFANEEGIQEITGSLATDDPNQQGDQVMECEQPAGTPAGAEQGVCADQVTKNWVPDQLAECEDGIDNDGDGLVDFPDDPGCTGPDDNTEQGDVARGPCAGRNFNTRTPIQGGTGFIIVGSPGDDAIVGSDGDDLICALGGDDTVDALDGKDQVLGGAGDDILSGGGGNDVLAGGRGHDTLKGNRGIDTLRGGGGRDVLQGGRGADQLTGGDGDDILRGWNGDDSLSGNGGNDTLRGGRHFDVCSGGPGQDEVFGCEA